MAALCVQLNTSEYVACSAFCSVQKLLFGFYCNYLTQQGTRAAVVKFADFWHVLRALLCGASCSLRATITKHMQVNVNSIGFFKFPIVPIVLLL